VVQQVSIVTGGADGIDRVTGRRLAARGDLVVANDISADAAEQAWHDIEAAGGSCVVVLGHIVVEDALEQITTTALEHGAGRVDCLVNNLGDFRPASRDFLHSQPERWQRL
jgi:NAD(P)-dependent dehydrogenase (short-subunit alcohol dehydrogenase family)